MQSKRIGNIGEDKVNGVLNGLPSCNFKAYPNVMLKTGGGTTQIDHIVVSRRGIFVIETKNYKGRIFGDPISKYWTQCLYGKGGTITKNKFYSPYKQNQGHLRNVIKSLGTNSLCGVICFANEDVDLSGVSCESVVLITNLYNLIENIYSYAPIADYDFYSMCDKLESTNIQSSYFERRHKKYVENLK